MTGTEFDLLGSLPTGTTLLEASAGTGKTYTIAGLVTRYVAEGVATLDELLVVTFGRLATQELRDRVRARLVGARDALTDPAAALAGKDPLLQHLAATDAAARRQRLVEALSSFDAATVATTHEFCFRMLAGLGTAADVDDNATFVENLDDLTVEVVSDLYLMMWSRPSAADAPMTVAEATELAHAVVRDGQAVLVPVDAPKDSDAGLRHRFAVAVRTEVERRKRDRHLLTFVDLLTRLHTTLTSEGTASRAADRLRAQYRVVLIDEFQDTDPVQWDILRAAFHGHATLVLIGDPKQAIYAFRGADVQAYLAASGVADHRATLAHNWRSDPVLLDGLRAVFRGAALGDERIVVHDVTAGHAGRSYVPPPAIAPAPVAIRAVRADPGLVDGVRATVVQDVAATVVALLEDAAPLSSRDRSPARRLQPGDIAIVVDTNNQLDLVHDALLAAGVPSVRRTTSSVFKTPAGTDWIVLLQALAQPRIGNLRRLAITPFVGWGAAELDTRDLDALGLRLRRWIRVLDERGIAALLDAVTRDERMTSRLLAQVDGERLLTDIRHVGEALHSAASAEQLGLTAMIAWLRRRVRESHRDTTAERSRRLDSDAASVQIVTVWASKGLEFPVVLVPFEWDRHLRDDAVPLFHDENGRRVRDVGGPRHPGFARSRQLALDELLGEHLRLLYVAMTRAQALVIAWWAPARRNTPSAPLHRLLFTDDPASGVPGSVPVPTMATAAQILLARAVPPALSAAPVDPRPVPRWRGSERADVGLSAAALGRSLDTEWRRTSYSALTAAVHDTPAVGSEPEVEQKDDEPETPAAEDGGDGSLRDVASPMADLPGGAGFGTLVHSVLELLDPGAADLGAALGELVAGQVARFAPGEVDPVALTHGLLPALRTPLGPLAGGRALVDVPASDRLVELNFELPLRGGDVPNGVSYLRDIAQLLNEHLPADDPVRAYALDLAEPTLGAAVLSGYLNGSIDAVLRVDGSYLVVDYKTNRLGVPDVALTAWDYRGPALAAAMRAAHYPLQALLYDVALHRFLRWRVTGYDPDRHLGGTLYLFLRGMCGPGIVDAGGAVPGVFSWRPPSALVVAVSDLLARGRT